MEKYIKVWDAIELPELIRKLFSLQSIAQHQDINTFSRVLPSQAFRHAEVCKGLLLVI